MPSGVRFAINRALRNATGEAEEGIFKTGAKKAKKKRRVKPKIGVTLKRAKETYTDPVTKQKKHYYKDSKGMLYRPIMTSKGTMMKREDGVFFVFNKSTGRWVPEGK